MMDLETLRLNQEVFYFNGDNIVKCWFVGTFQYKSETIVRYLFYGDNDSAILGSRHNNKCFYSTYKEALKAKVISHERSYNFWAEVLDKEND